MGKYSHYSERDPEFSAIESAVVEGMNALWSLPLDQMKAASKLPGPAPEDIPMDVTFEDREVVVRDDSKVGIRIYKGKNVPPNALLLLVVHGGGWTICGHALEETMIRYVVDKNNAVGISIDYRMAPEFPYPYCVNDSFDVLKWCLKNASSLGIDPNRIVLGGCSAGGNLSAVIAQMARDNNMPNIIGQVLNIPVTCHPKFFPKQQYEYESFKQNEDAPILSAERMNWFWELYTPNPQPEAYHSPLLAESLEGLPPALVQVAGLDPLRDEGIAYADALKKAGVKVQLEIFAGVPHNFGNLPTLSKTKVYYQNMVDFITSIDQGESRL